MSPLRLTSIDEARDWVRGHQQRGRRIGLVPTMGALHDGHLSLMHAARDQNDRCIATIFVNPTQFAPDEDLEQYPRPLQQDLTLLADAGVDAVFTPTNAVMYPDGFGTYVHPPPVADRLEGQHRPAHFRGVTTVVMKLFQILPADNAYFGQKDFQQWKVIQRMVEDLNVPTSVIGCPIVREPDGLAMSSRNVYLSQEQRQRALSLSRGLDAVEQLVVAGQEDIETLRRRLRKECESADEIDYAEIVDTTDLQPLRTLDRDAVALVAAKFGTTRLIDNRMLPKPAGRN